VSQQKSYKQLSPRYNAGQGHGELNETKSVHIDFTKKRIEHKPIYINHHVVPYENTAKHLGMTLDAKLRWKPHMKKKKGRTRTEIQKNVLANGSLFGPIYI
jgi:uncharacterized protein YpmS